MITVSDHILQCMKEDSSSYYPTSGYRVIPGVREVPVEIAYKTFYIYDIIHKYIDTPDIKILNKLKEMTHEESKNMWELEKKNSRPELFTKPMKKLYDIVEKCIEDDVIRYDDFTSDMIDELTTVMVENGKKEEETTLDRAEQIDQICNNLTKKYEQKYSTRESGVGVADVHTDSVEVQDTEGLCESECATVESTDDSTEIA